MPLPHNADIGLRDERYGTELRVQPLTREENKVQPVRPEIVKQVFVRLCHMEADERQALLKLRENGRDPKRKSVVVRREPHGALQMQRIDPVLMLEVFQRIHEPEDTGIALLRAFSRLHQEPASGEKGVVPVGPQFREHPVRGREAHPHLLRGPRERPRAVEREKEVERLRVDPPDIGGEGSGSRVQIRFFRVLFLQYRFF